MVTGGCHFWIYTWRYFSSMAKDAVAIVSHGHVMCRLTCRRRTIFVLLLMSNTQTMFQHEYMFSRTRIVATMTTTVRRYNTLALLSRVWQHPCRKGNGQLTSRQSLIQKKPPSASSRLMVVSRNSKHLETISFPKRHSLQPARSSKKVHRQRQCFSTSIFLVNTGTAVKIPLCLFSPIRIAAKPANRPRGHGLRYHDVVP